MKALIQCRGKFKKKKKLKTKLRAKVFYFYLSLSENGPKNCGLFIHWDTVKGLLCICIS